MLQEPALKTADLAMMIEAKLARNRFQDLADVISLIRTHNLHDSFAQWLPPAMHELYFECVEAMRREDEWETNQDRIMQEVLAETKQV